jgi:hypothetical protein
MLRTVTELTFSPFEIKKAAAQRYIPRKHKRLDWFCANKELCDQIVGGTDDIRQSLETIPPWFKPPNNRTRAGTDHATIVLQINTPNTTADNTNKKKEACANAKVLSHACKDKPTYAQRAAPILANMLHKMRKALEQQNDRYHSGGTDARLRTRSTRPALSASHRRPLPLSRSLTVGFPTAT